MADERNAASRMETARKKEGAHNAANFPPVPTAGESATYDPYSNAALYRTLTLMAGRQASTSSTSLHERESKSLQLIIAQLCLMKADGCVFSAVYLWVSAAA